MTMAKLIPWSISAFLFSLYIALLSSPSPTSAQFWQGTYWCKCICFSNYTILPLSLNEQAAQPCLSCTKQWCLDQDLEICTDAVIAPADPDTATGKEGDVEARCFERDSPRDQLVVTVFLILVFGLLVGAAVKGRMDQANMSLNWNTGNQRWWEALLPSRQSDAPYSSLNTRTSQRIPSDGYVDLQTDESPSR